MTTDNQFITRTSDSLFEDDDIDDDTFLANSRPPNKGASPPNERLEQLRQQKEDIEQRTLDSSKRSLGLLHDTEHVGMATAEELAKQREQLENTNKQLDMISTTLRSSQKHINGLKSVFGGLKNYLTGQRNVGPQSNGVPNPAHSGTQSPTAADTSYDGHPVARLRGDGPTSPTQHQQQQLEGGGAGRSTYSEQLDQNLDLMSGSLSRLKGLAMDMNQEIESHNDLIDNISNKVEDVDVKIQRQNRDLNKMLKK